MVDSPIFDPVTGFGGDGVPGTYNPPTTPGNPTFPGFPGMPGGTQGCVGTGPFNTTIVRLGPGTAVGDHCLLRAVNDNMKSSVTSANVRTILSRTTFESFRTSLENGGQGITGMGIHGGGHGVVGGEMMNPYSSPAGQYSSFLSSRQLLTLVGRSSFLSSPRQPGSYLVEVAVGRPHQPFMGHFWAAVASPELQHYSRLQDAVHHAWP
jgi:hypothetical protein